MGELNGGAGAPHILCLLPVRNGQNLLATYFDNIRKFSRNIIALDDGSTDNTLSLLEKEPMVKIILRNPVRSSYAEWDDGENRRYLLNACAPFRPQWILWLDADELIVEHDIAHLLALTSRVPDHPCAFGLEVLRLIGDHEHYDKNKMWAYRLFPYFSALTMPQHRLHFEPVPQEIGRHTWRRTRLRIGHRAGMTAALRQARFLKYAECDPSCEWQDDYAALLDPPRHVWTLRPLPAGQPLLMDEAPDGAR